MRIERFEDIEAWKNAKQMTLMLYEVMKDNNDFGFRNQLLRASVSVMNNIAEGFERRTNNEFKHFLYIAKGSAGEVRSMMYLAEELKYIEDVKCKSIFELSLITSKMLANFIKKL
jgi:four helix bundle protein